MCKYLKGNMSMMKREIETMKKNGNSRAEKCNIQNEKFNGWA